MLCLYVCPVPPPCAADANGSSSVSETIVLSFDVAYSEGARAHRKGRECQDCRRIRKDDFPVRLIIWVLKCPIMPFLRLLILFYECPKTDSHASNTLVFSKNSFSFTSLPHDSFEESVSLKHLSLLWLVRCRSPLWLVYSANERRLCKCVTLWLYSRNRIRFLKTRCLGDCELTLYVHIHTCMKVNIRKGIIVAF